MKTIKQQIYADGYRSNEIVWDGTSDCGATMGTGMYVYALSLSLPDGSVIQKTSKLVILR
jgi:flagellar hook assembly protein FlgD